MRVGVRGGEGRGCDNVVGDRHPYFGRVQVRRV
jgi:hypothetical protein